MKNLIEDEIWVNLPKTCADFTSHPHKVLTTITHTDKNGDRIQETMLRGCYTCQMALASEEQGTTQLASALMDLGMNCEVVQTGGFTMCVYIKTGKESYIYANEEGFSFYRDEKCEGLENFCFPEFQKTSAKEKAQKIQEKMQTFNLQSLAI